MPEKSKIIVARFGTQCGSNYWYVKAFLPTDTISAASFKGAKEFKQADPAWIAARTLLRDLGGGSSAVVQEYDFYPTVNQ